MRQSCQVLPELVGPAGFEPTTFTVGNLAVSKPSLGKLFSSGLVMFVLLVLL